MNTLHELNGIVGNLQTDFTQLFHSYTMLRSELSICATFMKGDLCSCLSKLVIIVRQYCKSALNLLLMSASLHNGHLTKCQQPAIVYAILKLGQENAISKVPQLRKIKKCEAWLQRKKIIEERSDTCLSTSQQIDEQCLKIAWK